MKIILNNVRLAFADLFTPRAFEEGSNPKYGAALLIPKKSPFIKEIEATILAVATEKWAAKAKTTLESIKNNPTKYCFQDGDLKEDYDGYADHMSLSAKADKRPLVIDRDRSPLTVADGRPYSGCYVNVSVDIWCQDNKFGKGIRCKLGGVQFFKDGDAFSGGVPTTPDDFEEVSDDSELA